MYIEKELKERFFRCLRLSLAIFLTVISIESWIFGPQGFSLWFLIYIVIVSVVNGLVIWNDHPETRVKRRKKLVVPFFIVEIVMLIFIASYLFSAEWHLKNLLLLLGSIFLLALDGYQALEMLEDFMLRKKGRFLLGTASALAVIGLAYYLFSYQSH